MSRPRDPTALKVLKGKSHMTKEEKSKIADEIYVSEGEIETPDYLSDRRMQTLFEKYASYMKRVNNAAGVAIYGDTDIESLSVMVMSHFRYLQYQELERKTKEIADRARYNQMKNKEAATHERFLKLLKLDPASRVDFGSADGGSDDEDEF